MSSGTSANQGVVFLFVCSLTFCKIFSYNLIFIFILQVNMSGKGKVVQRDLLEGDVHQER